jgi:hypothetical protein
MMEKREEALTKLWCEPWLDAHPSWHETSVAPPTWTSLATTSPVGLRLAHGIWCHHFDIVGTHPVFPSDSCRSTFELVGWSPRELESAALFIGMVGAARAPEFAGQWVRERKAALAGAGIPAWRRAVALARARSSAVHMDSCPSMEADELIAWGWCRLRSVLDTLWPQSWSRVQFRCDAALVERTPQLRLSWFCGSLTEPDARDILRAWHTAAHLDAPAEAD